MKANYKNILCKKKPVNIGEIIFNYIFRFFIFAWLYLFNPVNNFIYEINYLFKFIILLQNVLCFFPF